MNICYLVPRNSAEPGANAGLSRDCAPDHNPRSDRASIEAARSDRDPVRQSGRLRRWCRPHSRTAGPDRQGRSADWPGAAPACAAASSAQVPAKRPMQRAPRSRTLFSSCYSELSRPAAQHGHPAAAKKRPAMHDWLARNCRFAFGLPNSNAAAARWHPISSGAMRHRPCAQIASIFVIAAAAPHFGMLAKLHHLALPSS